jgi:hypothetical protein
LDQTVVCRDKLEFVRGRGMFQNFRQSRLQVLE